MAMHKARKILGEKKSPWCSRGWKVERHWGSFVEPSTARCPSDGQNCEHQDRTTSSTVQPPHLALLVSSWPIFFISLHTLQGLQMWRGRAQEQLGMGKGPPAAGDEAELQLWIQKCFRESTASLGWLGTPGTWCVRALQGQPRDQRRSRAWNHLLSTWLKHHHFDFTSSQHLSHFVSAPLLKNKSLGKERKKKQGKKNTAICSSKLDCLSGPDFIRVETGCPCRMILPSWKWLQSCTMPSAHHVTIFL